MIEARNICAEKLTVMFSATNADWKIAHEISRKTGIKRRLFEKSETVSHFGKGLLWSALGVRKMV
jgi:hypothetical protein